jgi:hypothetical protein
LRILHFFYRSEVKQRAPIRPVLLAGARCLGCYMTTGSMPTESVEANQILKKWEALLLVFASKGRRLCEMKFKLIVLASGFSKLFTTREAAERFAELILGLRRGALTFDAIA